MAKWKRARCSHCSGYGVGMYGDGPVWECGECGGGGFVWVSEKNRVATWPGGPFQGSWPGEYQRQVELTGTDNNHIPPPSVNDQFETLAEEISCMEWALKEIAEIKDKSPDWYNSTAQAALDKAKAIYERICR